MVLSSNLGYPRIGKQREWKKTIEQFWAGSIDEAQLHTQLKEIRLAHLKKQKDAGIDIIPVHDFSYYDHVLDTSVMLGIIPSRFQYSGGKVSTALYYDVARGNKEQPASEMTKWYNTNYHYIVPELRDVNPQLTVNTPLEAFREAKQELGIIGKPVIVGLYSYIKLSKGYEPGDEESWVKKLLPIYVQMASELEQEGVEWVQFDEPSLVQSFQQEDKKLLALIYGELAKAAPSLNIVIQTYFDSVECYDELVSLPVAAIGLDGVHGWEATFNLLQSKGFPADKWLAIGLIDGRNIWRADLAKAASKLEQLTAIVDSKRLIIQPSSSLLHVPVTVAAEDKLAQEVKEVLAFADEKLTEVALLARYVDQKACKEWEQALSAAGTAYEALAAREERKQQAHLKQEIAALSQEGLSRTVCFEERYSLQRERLNLPLLPTTTIGSFPQTPEVRTARGKWRKGEWTTSQYDAFIEQEIDRWIQHQEKLGLDVFVHGEFERTDMVEFFGEKLGGFCFTANGWVQSYGSRCVKPPIIYGDVTFLGPMTVKETIYAQSKTNKPVKGMLTGPVTIMNWSFVRQDITRAEIVFQLAYALRQEVIALEQAGISIIQVDEPAVREGLPLKDKEHQQYLQTSIDAFKLTTSGVQPQTQIHTHMCYCDFSDMIGSIRNMDADVISIETSRSHGELIHNFEEQTYDLGIGLGVYDIHSPRVPPAAEMTNLIKRALEVLDPALFWINPDCGLKTRREKETIAALEQMIIATKHVRQELQQLAK